MDLAEEVMTTADEMGYSYSEYIAWLIAQAHEHDFTPEVSKSTSEGQEELPMASAS